LSFDPTGRTAPHPDLIDSICAFLSNMGAEYPLPEHALSVPVTPDRVQVAFQRTWHGIRCANPALDGASFAACSVVVENGARPHAYFLTAGRGAGHPAWGIAGAQGGPRPPRDPHPGGSGNMSVPGAYICVGGKVASTGIARVQVEYADGSVFADDAGDDGIALVFAPLPSPAAWADEAVMRYFDRAGNEIGSERRWVNPERPRRA
jgi:hypothetical protein